ncbi:histone-lysine N-methyltransferase, H3 lysine-79 specific [Condylostylus longicornis]|uniref:histone-lysine N-methyltransferase, H3 lysine-79 specific n=1 Tax=Condylostylus longicornis TaxID=2530218 RepID=UPI00244E13BC|nr:histone-lysine N-methyltransferase, H3 lysine-79 specific [Condylostylus longicornis]
MDKTTTGIIATTIPGTTTTAATINVTNTKEKCKRSSKQQSTNIIENNENRIHSDYISLFSTPFEKYSLISDDRITYIITEKLNATPIYIEATDGLNKGYFLENNTFYGVLNDLIKHNTDITFNGRSYDGLSLILKNNFEILYPYQRVKECIVIPKSNLLPRYMNLLQTLDKNTCGLKLYWQSFTEIETLKLKGTSTNILSYDEDYYSYDQDDNDGNDYKVLVMKMTYSVSDNNIISHQSTAIPSAIGKIDTGLQQFNLTNRRKKRYHRHHQNTKNQYYFHESNNDSYDDDIDDNDLVYKIDNTINNPEINTNSNNNNENEHDADDDDDDDNDNEEDDDDDDDNDEDLNSNDSIETVSDEIPIWAFGEQRWISGVNEDTTCSDLINVLLADEGIITPLSYQNYHRHSHHHHHHNNHSKEYYHHYNQQQQQQQKQIGLPERFLTSKLHDSDLTGITTIETTNTTATTGGITSQTASLLPSTTIDNNKIFVITERWRRVEQILSNDTKVLQIWSAWGQAKSEVKLTLRQIDSSLTLDTSCYSNNNDKDSGMGSPIGSSNSAIMRRRKHRASKSTAAWVTQANTMHPKSQKTQIEKLMKLILEQGETIQQQLAKLRDRELQIAKIEEERHKNREKEHGKNYLLETYLNGLHEVEEKEVVTGNSDSGVQTEGALSSPEICSSSNPNEDEDYIIETSTTAQSHSTTILASLPTPKILRQNPKHHNDINNINSNFNHNISSLTSLTTPQLNVGAKICTSLLPINSIKSSTLNTFPFKEKPSHREKKLLKEHKQTKEYSSYLQQYSDANLKGLELDERITTISKDIKTATWLSSLDADASSTTPATTILPILDNFNIKKQNQTEQTKNQLSSNLTELNKDVVDDDYVDSNNHDHHQNKDVKSSSKNSRINRKYNNEEENIVLLDEDFHIGYNKNSKDYNSKIKDLHDNDTITNNENISEKIQWMEKLVMINKHLQREEELLVRLGAKIRKYESENPLLDENQIREALSKVNNHLETGNMEIEKLELDLLSTKEQLEKRFSLLQNLNKELIEKEKEEEERKEEEEEQLQQDNEQIQYNEEELKLQQLNQSTNEFGNENQAQTPSQNEINPSKRINPDELNGYCAEERKCVKKKSETRKVGFSNSIKVVDIPLDDIESESENDKSNNLNENQLVKENISEEQQPQQNQHQQQQSVNLDLIPPNINLTSHQMYIAPPPPGFDSPNYNSNDLLITAPTQIQLNQPYQIQLNQSGGFPPGTNATTTRNIASSIDQQLGLSLNHAKNLNFSKTLTTISSKNINPTNSLSKTDLLHKPGGLYLLDNSQFKTPPSNINNNYSNGCGIGVSNSTSKSLITPISSTTATTHIDRSLVSIPSQLHIDNQSLLPHSDAAVPQISENCFTLKNSYTLTNLTPPTTTNILLQRQPSNCNQINNCSLYSIDHQSIASQGSATNLNKNLLLKYGIGTIKSQTSTILPNSMNSVNNGMHNYNGPKRFLNNNGNEFESNSDTGLSSLSDDVIHLGTLV